jgi:lipopolysaccharide export system protein LptA
MHSNCPAPLNIKSLLACIALMLCQLSLYGQGKSTIDIKQAGELLYEDVGDESIRKLIGNVILQQNDVLLYCDSALLYAESKKTKAFGNVRIVQENKFNARSRYLEYDGQTKDALLRQDVFLTDGEMNLTTQELHYNTRSKIARYYVGATITNQEATLTSKKGTYDSNIKQFYFKEKVRLKHPDFDLVADTLHYNNLSERADFFGPTDITSKRTISYTEAGWYKIKTKESFFTKEGYVAIDSQQFIKADTIYFNESDDRGYCKGGVQMLDTVERTEIRGGHTIFDRKAGWNRVYQHPLLANFGDSDTLYLTADTIYQYKQGDTSSVLRAWNNTVITRADLLVNCDSLSYVEVDSMFRLFEAPIIWSDEFQISAEYMELFTRDKEFDRLEMYREGFLVKEEDTVRFSQIKGKNMTAWFENRQIARMDVKGNGESIYYVERDDGSFMGANKIESSDITIVMEDNRPVEITFYVKPVAVLHPIDQVDPYAFRLAGFFWAIERKTDALARMDTTFERSPERGLYSKLFPQAAPVGALPEHEVDPASLDTKKQEVENLPPAIQLLPFQKKEP